MPSIRKTYQMNINIYAHWHNTYVSKFPSFPVCDSWNLRLSLIPSIFVSLSSLSLFLTVPARVFVFDIVGVHAYVCVCAHVCVCVCVCVCVYDSTFGVVHVCACFFWMVKENSNTPGILFFDFFCHLFY